MAKEKAYTRRTDTDQGQKATVASSYSTAGGHLIFGKNNYKFVLIGVGLLFLGLALMSGGHMPSPDVWDESLIYSHRRITVAPILILAGLVVNVYAIFVKK